MTAGRRCPACAAAAGAHGTPCAACGAVWVPGTEVSRGLGAGFAAFRRAAARGPLAFSNCADCGGALKSVDVPGAHHEGDLFWGPASPRPPGSAVVDACPRCGGLLCPGGEVERGGGAAAVLGNLERLFPGIG